MTTMKKIVCLLLACALLLSFGCKKKPQEEAPPAPEASDTPVQTPPAEPAPTPPAEQEPVREINTQPVLLPDVVTAEIASDSEARQAAFNSYQEVGYFLEWQLGEDYRILEVLPGDKDGEYLLWGMRIKTPGLREPFQMLVQVSPDGKDFNLLSKQMLDVSEEWKAVQNYRWLVSSLSHGPRPLLESLGFTPVITDNLTDISYDAFEASMLSIMTQKLYDAHWADYFWEQDGKLAIHEDFGGGEDRYLVESVQVQEDGTVLSHEFCHDFADEFTVYTVQAELEELPNGSFRVSAWNADNADLMASPFPVPTGEKMGLTGEDAVLYTALAKEVPADADTLILLSVELLGSYPGEDGETHYVCEINENHFHDAALASSGITYSSTGGKGYLSRVTIALDGLLEYTYSTLDGADNTDRAKEIFGPLTAQHTAWEKGEAISGARQLLPTGTNLLELYQLAYFPEN